MEPFVRWALLPAAVFGLGVGWQYQRLAKAIGANCYPDCITSGEIAAWRVGFLVALVLWIAVIAAPIRRKRRDGECR
jgi:hypothetical protein